MPSHLLLVFIMRKALVWASALSNRRLLKRLWWPNARIVVRPPSVSEKCEKMGDLVMLSSLCSSLPHSSQFSINGMLILLLDQEWTIVIYHSMARWHYFKVTTNHITSQEKFCTNKLVHSYKASSMTGYTLHIFKTHKNTIINNCNLHSYQISIYHLCTYFLFIYLFIWILDTLFSCMRM
jgi:hypothetical protein